MERLGVQSRIVHDADDLIIGQQGHPVLLAYAEHIHLIVPSEPHL